MSTKGAGTELDASATSAAHEGGRARASETAPSMNAPAHQSLYSSSLPPESGAVERSRGGWTLHEKYERDGYSYRVWRRPVDGSEGADGPRLTPREEQVVECASDGRTNKSVAHALGLSPSTVGVLLSRAAAKLGAKSRAELLAAYYRFKSSGK